MAARAASASAHAAWFVAVDLVASGTILALLGVLLGDAGVSLLIVAFSRTPLLALFDFELVSVPWCLVLRLLTRAVGARFVAVVPALGMAARGRLTLMVCGLSIPSDLVRATTVAEALHLFVVNSMMILSMPSIAM